jgi:HAD superfamily hydrolase (TIGR01509 family)
MKRLGEIININAGGPMIRAIIFDFDGTILETESPDYHSWREIFEEHGAELPLELWAQYIGTSIDTLDPYAHLEKCIGQQVDREHIRSRRRKRHDELVLQERVLPGVVELISEAKEAGLKIGLASSSSRDWVVGHLSRLGMLEHFEVIKTSDDVQRVKPDPELYLRAVQALNVSAEETLAIEDSVNGLLAAKRAGLHCIAVPNAMTKHLSFEGADAKYGTLLDFRLVNYMKKD